jgi:hypothetical protein
MRSLRPIICAAVLLIMFWAELATSWSPFRPYKPSPMSLSHGDDELSGKDDMLLALANRTARLRSMESSRQLMHVAFQESMRY